LTGSTNNTLVTVTGANAITGESLLTYTPNGNLEIKGTGECGPHMFRDGGNGPDIVFHGSKGTIASPSASAASDFLGNINFAGYDGSGYHRRAAIRGVVDGTVVDGTDTIPTALTFLTATNSLTERMRIDSGGRLLVGSTSSQSVYATAQVQIQGTDGNASSLSLLRHGNSPYLILGSSAGSSLGAVNALSNGNRIGQITFAGADGTDVNTHSASIAAYVDGSVSSNSVPADIAFQFGTSETQKVVIKNSGTIELKAANAQFKSESTSSGDWVRMYAGAGTGQWDIYGNGDHLRFTDNSNAGAARFDSRIGAGTHPSHAQLVSYFSGTASYPPSGGLVQNDNDSHGLQVWNGSNSAAYSALKLETKTTLASIWLMSNVYNSNYSGDLTFITRTGGSSNAERVRFRRDGGITFNGDTAAANALDDYEEGTFSATASAAGYSGGSAISMSDEKYTKIGRIVHFNMRLSVASNLSDGDLTITNLPFSAVQESVVDFSWQDAASFAGGQGKISGTSCVRFGGTFPTHSSGTANIIFSGTYIAS